MHPRKKTFPFLQVESIVPVSICIGIGVLIPLSAASLPLLMEQMRQERVLLTKVLIVVLGVICSLPLLCQSVKRKLKDVEVFSPTILFPLLYFAVFGLGSLKLYAIADTRVLTILIYAVFGVLFYYFGVVLTTMMVGLKSKEHRNRAIYRRVVEWDPYLLKLAIATLIIMSFVATIYHVYKTGLPIFIPNIEELRVAIQWEVTNYVLFLMRLITPAFFFLLVYGLLHRGVRVVSLVGSFVAGTLVLLSLTNRHDIFTFFMGSLLIYHFATKNLTLVRTIPVIMTGLIALMLIGFYRLATLSYATPEKLFLAEVAGSNPVLMFLAYSVFQFTNYPLNFAIYLDTFPRVLPFEWGYSFVRAISTILPGHQELLDEFVKATLGLDFLGGGINPTLLGELHANFGYGGVVGMTVYGALITLLFYRMLLNRNGINILAYSYALSSLLLSLVGGFFSHFLYFYYIIVIAIVHFVTRRKTFEILTDKATNSGLE